MNTGFHTYDVVGRSELMGSPHRTGTNGLVIHRPPSTGGLEGVKEWLDKRSVGNIQNKYLVAGAAALGLAYYGYTQRWF